MNILLVEDNEGDVELLREGIEITSPEIAVHHVENGEECMAFLRKLDKHSEAPTPDLILLDLNLPVMDGREVMAAINADQQLKHLPVIVLTTSTAQFDILKMYQLRCSSYIVKPVNFSQFLQIIRSVIDYWFGVVVLPRKNQAPA